MTTIAQAKQAALDARDRREDAELTDLRHQPWVMIEHHRAYVDMIGGCDIVTTNAEVARSVTAYAPKTRAGRIHGDGILTTMLEAFSQAYPPAAEGRIDTLSDTCQTLTW